MEGWVPEQIIQKVDKQGIITEEYSANELNANENDVVTKFRELNGWGWCQCDGDDELGWIPMENLKLLD
ncbi:SH3 domain-containing protein [Heyndrickxia sp. NPDC080065]|uniref:SH3 domain-containing protein n=1 Tax=Heyndrickxia sp. NPDC080065 TaxID=3390568 RepID=UPI003D0066AF